MLFQELQESLVGVLRSRVRNGEITERGLARITGVSQPHIHNVLKGVRVLSNGLSDRILTELQISVQDLWDRNQGDEDIPVMQDWFGPGRPYPREIYSERRPFTDEVRQGLQRPALFRLGEDPDMAPDLMAGDLVLIDRSTEVRANPGSNSMWLIHRDGCGLGRYLWREGSIAYLATARTRSFPDQWQRVPLHSQGYQDILELVRGRIVWIGRQVEATPGSPERACPATGPAGGTG